jgi:glycosyltransferase involved in cell wall biosynthesis
MPGSENRDVTVVIACFNYGEFLPEALDSVLSQEGGPPHVTVVDDGSTDERTRAELERLPPGVELIRQDNHGLAAARNTGFRRASTPLLIPVDADDRLAPGALVRLKRGLHEASARDSSIGFSYGYAKFFGDWDAVLRTPPYDGFKLLYRHMIGATCLMRRELFEDVGGYDPEFRGSEDWEFWLNALDHGWHGYNIGDVALEYRRHGQTMLSGARSEYRHWFRRLRDKHSGLYARDRELAADSDLSVAGRAVYRWFWGPRPVPAAVEARLYRRLFGSSRPS